MINWLNKIDRRWIFLLMALSVGVPILIQKTLPEAPTPLAQSTFDQLDQLPSGSKVLLSFDFDPASEGELGPMATSFVNQCARKGHKMYFMALLITSQGPAETLLVRLFFIAVVYLLLLRLLLLIQIQLVVMNDVWTLFT